MSETKLHKIWWLWVPVVYMTAQLVAERALSDNILSHMHGENGLVELLEFAVITPAFLVAAYTLITVKFENIWLKAWVALAALCCFYVAGEEISWGQHILMWSTPEFWLEHNDQGETNLHNMSSWLDQKPRLILLLGVVVGGLVIPALQKWKPSVLPAKFETIYPSAKLGVITAFALAIQITDKIDESLDTVIIFERASEVQELYLFYFVLLYLVTLRCRLVNQQA